MGDLNLIVDPSNVKENYIGLADEKTFEVVFRNAGITDEILFSETGNIKQMDIQSKLKSYAIRNYHDSLKKFLEKYKFSIDCIDEQENPLVGKVSDVHIKIMPIQ